MFLFYNVRSLSGEGLKNSQNLFRGHGERVFLLYGLHPAKPHPLTEVRILDEPR